MLIEVDSFLRNNLCYILADLLLHLLNACLFVV